MTIRTALIGFGTAGRVFHAPLIAADPAFTLTHIVTAAAARIAAARAEHPSATIVAGMDALLERSDEFDLIVIGSPNETHAPIARRTIALGKHVVVDKPIAVTAVEARDVLDEARAAGVVLTVFQNRRWDGDFRTLRSIAASGALGELRQLDSAFEWFAPEVTDRWKDTAAHRAGGGVTYDLAPHLIDQAVVLLGPVEALHAELDARRPGASADDESLLSLRHTSGARSRLWMSTVAPVMRPRFRLVGSEAVAEIPALDPQESQLIAGLRPGSAGFGLHDDDRGVATVTRHDGSVERIPLEAGDYRPFYAQLATAILDGAAVPVDPAESVVALDLIERAVAP